MKVVIFHGWGANSQNNWFPWLKGELEKHKIKVFCPDLPNTHYPKQKEWLEKALDLTEYDEKTILVGHSLGAALIMRILEKTNTQIKAAFLVSAFDEGLGIPEIASFFKFSFDYQKIKENCKKIFILNSDDDNYVPLEVAKALAKKLDCKLQIFHNKQHLSAGTDNFMFKELRDMILNEST